MIIIDYLEQGRTINGAYYAAKLSQLRQEIARKKWGLLQDNAPAHTSQDAMTAATECGFEIFPHPPYSPDMAPSDFCLFPKRKSHLCGTQYGSNEGVKRGCKQALATRKTPFYFEGIRKFKQCIALREIILKSNGHFFIPW